jgi:hypothetical protein
MDRTDVFARRGGIEHRRPVADATARVLFVVRATDRVRVDAVLA